MKQPKAHPLYCSSAPETIQALFASIAPNYDKANTLFTFGLHKRWNLQLIKQLKGTKRLLDLCAGTGEIAFGFLKENPFSKAILLDFCPEMLAMAQAKGKRFDGNFELLQADAQAIPLLNDSVDGVSISYGIRNVKDPKECFSEVQRVLMPGGIFVILELTRPSSSYLRVGHRFYTKTLLPFLGKLAAKNKEAYHYLTQSVEGFASPELLTTQLKQAGFGHVERTPLLGGVATLFTALR